MKNLRNTSLLIVAIFFALQTVSAQQQKSYYFSKTVKGSFEEVTQRTKEELKKQGFGVITEIDMDVKLKEKLTDVDLKPYKILGACNPGFAYETLKVDENIGLFLPCKILIKELGNNKVEVVMVDPSVLMGMLGNKELEKIAQQVTDKFKAALKKI